MKGNSGVYLFKAVEGNLWKIGSSTRVRSRRAYVDSQQRRCYLIHIIETNDLFHLEYYLHGVYARKRHHDPPYREWFSLSTEDVHRLMTLTSVHMVGKLPADKAVRLWLEGRSAIPPIAPSAAREPSRPSLKSRPSPKPVPQPSPIAAIEPAYRPLKTPAERHQRIMARLGWGG